MLKTGGGPPLVENKSDDDIMNDQVRRIAPHINFTLENPYDSTSRFEGLFFVFYSL